MSAGRVDANEPAARETLRRPTTSLLQTGRATANQPSILARGALTPELPAMMYVAASARVNTLSATSTRTSAVRTPISCETHGLATTSVGLPISSAVATAATTATATGRPPACSRTVASKAACRTAADASP